MGVLEIPESENWEDGFMLTLEKVMLKIACNRASKIKYIVHLSYFSFWAYIEGQLTKM